MPCFDWCRPERSPGLTDGVGIIHNGLFEFALFVFSEASIVERQGRVRIGHVIALLYSAIAWSRLLARLA